MYTQSTVYSISLLILIYLNHFYEFQTKQKFVKIINIFYINFINLFIFYNTTTNYECIQQKK